MIGDWRLEIRDWASLRADREQGFALPVDRVALRRPMDTPLGS